MQDHLRRHQKRSEEHTQTYACVCGKEYKYRRAYDTHRLTCIACTLNLDDDKHRPGVTLVDLERCAARVIDTLGKKIDRAMDVVVPLATRYYEDKRDDIRVRIESRIERCALRAEEHALKKTRIDNASRKMDAIEGRMVERKKAREERAKQPKRKRRPYGGFEAPNRDMQHFDAASFVEAYRIKEKEYKEAGYVLEHQSAATIIAACVYGMNGGVPFLTINKDYPEDQYHNPLFFDLNEKGRWFNRVPRAVLFKRLMDAGRFLPPWGTIVEDGYKNGWEYYRNYLHQKTAADDPLMQTFECKMSFIRAVSGYKPPVSSVITEQDLDFDATVSTEGEFWTEFGDPYDVTCYDGFFPLSPKWNAVLRNDVITQHPDWADDVWANRLELARKREFEPGDRPW